MTTALFDPLEGSLVPQRSRVYSPVWVDRLYRGCRAHLTGEFRFVCLTHHPQSAFAEPVEAVPFVEDTRGVMCLTEVFRRDLGIERGLFIALDSVVIGSLDFVREYRGNFALPCLSFGGNAGMHYNPVCLYRGDGPAASLWENRAAGYADSACKMREFGTSEQLYWAKHYPGPIDDVHSLWPLRVVSIDWWAGVDGTRGASKAPGSLGEVRSNARIVYFYGEQKPHTSKAGLAWM